MRFVLRVAFFPISVFWYRFEERRCTSVTTQTRKSLPREKLRDLWSNFSFYEASLGKYFVANEKNCWLRMKESAAAKGGWKIVPMPRSFGARKYPSGANSENENTLAWATQLINLDTKFLSLFISSPFTTALILETPAGKDTLAFYAVQLSARVYMCRKIFGINFCEWIHFWASTETIGIFFWRDLQISTFREM